MIQDLDMSSAEEMADLHEKSIKPSWPVSDMKNHLENDLCLGAGDPLQAFIILRPVEDQAEILTLVTDPAHRQKGLARSVLEASEALLRFISLVDFNRLVDALPITAAKTAASPL